VLVTVCPQCELDTTEIDRSELGQRFRLLAADWRTMLGRGDIVHVRPPFHDGTSGEAWSALEYGAHVRDVFELFHDRLVLMVKKNDPEFPAWDHEAAAADYADEDPGSVAYKLATNAGKLATFYDKAGDGTWDRNGHRRDGSSLTIEEAGFYAYHEGYHHLYDAQMGIKLLTADDDNEGDVEPEGPDHE